MERAKQQLSSRQPSQKNTTMLLRAAALLLVLSSGIIGYSTAVSTGNTRNQSAVLPTTKIPVAFKRASATVILSTAQTISHVIQQTSPAGIILAPSFDKTGWKTFTDKGFGVAFRYPSAWTLGAVRKDPSNSKNGDAIFEGENGYEVHFNSYDNPNNLTYTEFMKREYPAFAERYSNVVLEPVTTVEEVRFQRVQTPAVEHGDIVFQQNGRLYMIANGSIGAGPQEVGPLTATLTQMLSTFHFMQ